MDYLIKLCIFFLCASAIFGAFTVSADTLPVITSFAASASAIGHGYGITFTWAPPSDNYSGSNFYFTCPQGVTIKTASGSDFSCNASGTAGGAVTATGAAFVVKNVGGFTQTVYVKIVPKDYAGTENAAGSMQTSFTVSSLSSPITSFTASHSPIPLGSAVTLSWTGFDISGANLQFNCVSGVHITSLSPAVAGDLPCGKPAYSSDLAASGSVTLNFTNDSAEKAQFFALILPSVTAGVYDSTHSLSLSREVAGKSAALLVSAMTSFSVSSERIISSKSAIFSWKAENATSSNLQIQCSSGVEVWGVDSPATTTAAKLPCGQPLFSVAQAASGSVELTFKNLSGVSEQMIATALPRNANGTYDATKGKTIAFTILPAEITPSAAATSSPSVAAPIATASPVTSVSAGISIARSYVFTVPLYFGKRGAAVSELQKFLAQDPALYPEGLVTGYFGSLTELAVRRFQKRYGLAQEGDPAFGFVGPKTRAKLNTIEQF